MMVWLGWRVAGTVSWETVGSGDEWLMIMLPIAVNLKKKLL